MVKKIEDFVVNLSHTEIGVRVVIVIKSPPDYIGVIHTFKVQPCSHTFPRFKAISEQVKRAIGLAGCLDSIHVSSYDWAADTIQVQFSYKVAVKGECNETGRVQRRKAGSNKAKHQRKKTKK